MHNDSIRVGGIYRFDIDTYRQRTIEWQRANGFPDAIPPQMPSFRPFDSVIISHKLNDFFYASTNNEQNVSINWVHPDCLHEEIGFDARYSEEYVTVNKRKEEAEGAMKAVQLLVDYFQNIQVVEYLAMKKLLVGFQVATMKMQEDLKGIDDLKSWGENHTRNKPSYG